MAVRPNGSVVLVGYARDRHPAFAVPPAPAVMYGQRAVVTLPATGNSTTACGAYPDSRGLSLGSAGVTVDGLAHDGTVSRRRARRPLVRRRRRARRTTATSSPPPTARPVGGQRRVAAALHGAGVGRWTRRSTLRARVRDASRRLRTPTCTRSSSRGTDAYAAGESIDAAIAANRRMLVARVDTNGAMVGGFGASGVALARVAGGNNTGQALRLPGRERDRRRLGEPRRQGGPRPRAPQRHNGARDATFGTVGADRDAVGTPADQRLHHRHGPDRATCSPSPAAHTTRPAWRRSPRATTPPAPRRPRRRSRPRRHGVDRSPRARRAVSGTVNANGTAEHLADRVRHDDRLRRDDRAQAIATLNDDTDVNGALTGLAAGTLYHARIVVSSAVGHRPR